MKKNISLLLAVLMIITMLPMGVAASGALAAPTVSDSNGAVLSSGADISTVEGELTLTFADGAQIDQSTLAGITIAATDAGAFEGALVATADANKIKLRFGRLGVGAYKLMVPATVGTATDTLASQFEFAFTAADNYLTKVDFSEERYASQPPTYTNGTDNLRYINAWGNVTINDNTIVTNGENKYMQITTSSADARGIYLDPTYTTPNYNFNDKSIVDADKVIVIDADIMQSGSSDKVYVGAKTKTSGVGISPAVLTAANTDIYKTAVAYLAYGNAVATLVGDATTATGNALTTLTKTGDWYKLRHVLRRDSSNNLASDLYNYGTGQFIGTDDTTIPEATAINQIGIAGAYTAAGTILEYDYIYARPERLLSVLSVDSYDGKTGSVTINMSDDMLDSSLDGISVTRDGEAVENFAVSKTADGRGITLTFEGGLPGGDYSVSLAGLRSSNGLNIYSESTTAIFNVSPYIATPSVPEGTISTVEGEIKLEFGVNIDPATLGGITFKKAGDTEIDGKYFVSVNGKVVTVRFGDLVEGQQYVLTLPDSVKSLETPAKAVNPQTYTYTAQKEFLTNTDFSDYTTDSTKAVEGEVVNGADNIYYTDNWNNTRASSITAVATENDTYVELTGTAGANGAGIAIIGPAENGKAFNFNTTDNIDKDKVYIVETDFTSTLDGTWGGSKFSANGGNWTNNRSKSLFGILVSGTTVKGAAVTKTAGDVRTRTFETVVEDGWFRPTMVMRRETDGKVYSDLYYRSSGVATYRDTDADVLGSADSFDAVALAGRGASSNVETIKITYAAAYPERLLSIIGDDGYTNAANAITLYTTKVVKAGTEDAIVIKKDGNIVPVSDISIGADGRSLTVTFAGTGLTPGSYDVYMSNDTSTVLDTAGIKAYEGEVYAFEVSEDQAAKVIGNPTVKCAAGNTLANGTEQAPAEISVTEGKVTLSFESVIANPEAITFTKADDSAIDGKYIARTNGTDVNIAFGYLDKDAIYKVTVPVTVKDVDNRTLAEEFVFYLKATEKYTTKVDFNAEEGYVVGSKPEQRKKNLQYYAGWEENLTDVTVKSENGENYVNVANTAEGAHGVLLMADGLPNNSFHDVSIVNENKAYVVEAKIRDAGNSTASRYFGMGTEADADGSPNSPGEYNYSIVQYRGTTAIGYGISGAPKITVAETGNWLQPVLVLRQSAENANVIDRELYDGLNSYAYKGKVTEVNGHDTPDISRSFRNARIALLSWGGNAGAGNDLAYVYARPETLLSVIYSDEYKDGEPIKLYMSDDVDASTIGNLKLTVGGIEVENITVEVDESDARTIIITAPDGLITGEYSVDVSALFSSRSKLRGSNSIYTFTVSEEEGTEILSLNNITASAGAIDVDTEKIEIAFGAPLAADALNGVDFTKANGRPIKGIVDKQLDGNKIIFNFGRLEDGVDYKLEIKENAVKSADGKLTARAQTVNYNGFEKYEVYQDFTSATLPDSAQPYGNDTATNWDGENIKVEISGDAEIKTENGDSYLEIGRDTTGRYGIYLRPLGKDHFNDIFFTNNTDGKILAFDIKIREKRIDDSNKTTFREPLLSIYSRNSGQTPIWDPLRLSGEDAVAGNINKDMLENYPTDSAYVMEKEAGTGYTHATAVLKAGEDNKYTNISQDAQTVTVDMSLFDVVAGKDLGNNICKNDQEGNDWDASTLDNTYLYNRLSWIRLAGRYYDNLNFVNNRLQITEFSVIHANAMDILKSYGYSDSSRTISVAMSDDVSEASLENIKVTKTGTNEEAMTSVSYDAEARIVTVGFPYGLAEGGYTLDVNGLSSVRGFNDGKMETISFTVGAGETYLTKPVFKCGEKTIVTEVKDTQKEILLSDATSLSLTATVGNKPEKMVIFVGVFDAEDNLVTAEAAEISDEGVISATTSEFAAGKANSIKLFMWEDMENLRPLFAPVRL